MAHNWQKWKSRPTCPCHKIYRVEVVGLKSSNTLKITIFVKMWNLGQFCEKLIVCQQLFNQSSNLNIPLHAYMTHTSIIVLTAAHHISFLLNWFSVKYEFPFPILRILHSLVDRLKGKLSQYRDACTSTFLCLLVFRVRIQLQIPIKLKVTCCFRLIWRENPPIIVQQPITSGHIRYPVSQYLSQSEVQAPESHRLRTHYGLTKLKIMWMCTDHFPLMKIRWRLIYNVTCYNYQWCEIW